jgi:hypothetical protein
MVGIEAPPGRHHVNQRWLTDPLVAATLACVAVASAAADSMRCERGLVFAGDTRQRVLELCGEPLSSHQEQYPTWGINRLGAHVEVLVEREVWTYDRGYGRFLGWLVFKDERLERIELGPRRE